MDTYKKIGRNNSLDRPISGSKPRKFITKTHLNNPSLLSNSVSALFLGDPRFNPQAKYHLMNQLQSNNHKKNSKIVINSERHTEDSLAMAEKQFGVKKQVKETLALQKQQQTVGSGLGSRRFSTPALMSLNRLNYASDAVIKTRQDHGYNIINCRDSK